MNRLHAALVALAAAASALALRGSIARSAPPGRYQRVLPMNCELEALELLEPDRIIGVNTWGALDLQWGHRLAGYPRVGDLADLEGVLRLRPDLVIASSFEDPAVRANAARLQELGVPVVGMKRAYTAKMIPRNLRAIADAVAEAARGEQAASGWTRAMDAVYAARPRERAPVRGMFLVGWGGGVELAGAESNPHDMLLYAGARDVAGESGYQFWSPTTAEHILAMHPDLIISRGGHLLENLWHVPGLDALPALHRPRGVIGFPQHYVAAREDDLLDATESISAQLWGEP